MKFYIQFLFLSLLVTPLAFSQWTNQNLVPDHNDLWSTFFVDDSSGWIVGSGGFIKKTTNAGNEWIEQNSGTTLILKAVQFVDQNTGWICGEAGLILKSTDGGTSWDSLSSGTTQHLSDIYFYDTDTGYVVGFNGTILKTTDGGLYWTSLNSGTTNNLYSMDFVDAFTGYAAGEVNDTSSVIKTTDGGACWIDKSGGFPTSHGSCLTVDFIDANTGFIGGSNPFFYKTTDGGDTWGQSVSPLALERKEINNREQLNIYPDAGITSVYFTDANNGWHLFWWGTDNYIYSTTDGGITWDSQRTLFEHQLLSVFVTQSGIGFAVGKYGLIYLKEDSGLDWVRLFSGPQDAIYSVYFVNEYIGWASGIRLTQDLPGGIVLNTTNGGKIWKTQLHYPTTPPFKSVYFINELIGWTLNEGIPGLLRTTDGGENWSSVGFGGGSSIFFTNQDTGWLTKSNGIYKSTDGGVTWAQKSSISSSSVYFSDVNNGWATSLNGILKSTDGGETWITKSSLSGSYIRFYDLNIGICVGGASVLVSADGGENWISKSSPSLQTINFINPVTVWGYTSEGTLHRSTNFGNTWDTLNTGLGFGETAFFADEYTGWVGGLNGTMFKYEVEPPPPPTPPVWSNQITVKDPGGTESSKTLTFGQHIDATDSIDTSLGEYELPPIPPSGIFDSRFNLPTHLPISSLIDYRDSSKTDVIWNLKFQPGSAGFPMTFTWDSTKFSEGTFYLKDIFNGSFVNVNMENQSSYTLTNPGITSLNISYRGLVKIMFVKNEWNMISVPLLAEDMSVSNLFPTATSAAYGFENGYVVEDTSETGVGYWLKFGGNEQIQIYGLTHGDTVSVKEGWNMFGVNENDVQVSQITTTPPGIVATYYFGYNNGYYIADTLKSGQGFWVRVTQDGVLNLNGMSLRKEGEDRQPLAKIGHDWGRIKITDSKGKSITLYATEKETDLSLFELPPMPPSGIFDVRYISGRVLENLDDTKIIQINSENYPITIRAEGISITIKDRINGELIDEVLTDGEEIRITNSKITSIEVTGEVTKGLPVTYELYQNYPNPFNPTTTIKFAIPKESNVNLSIYNVLGELVTTLVNGLMKAGFYEFEFNSINLASGMYLYRIKADNFFETRKMIVIK